MKLIDTLPFGCKLKIVTNLKTKEEYVLVGFVIGRDFLVPFVPHWNGFSGETVNPLYWEHHYAKKDTWIPMCKVNFDDWDITKEEFDLINQKSEESYKEILAKYHASF